MIEEMAKIFDRKTVSFMKYICLKDKYQLRDVSKNIDIPLSTIHRITQRLIKAGIVSEVKNSDFTSFFVNKESEIVKFFIEKTSKDPLSKFISLVKNCGNVYRIIQVGDKKMDGIALTLIGKDMDSARIKGIKDEIKSNFNFSIETVLLTNEQYNQMVALKFYREDTKIIYSSD